MIFETIRRLKSEGKKIGFTTGCFDVIHAGHVYMLEGAKSLCDYLIVGILVDPTTERPDTKNKPVQSILERFILIQGIAAVDYTIPFGSEADLVALVQLIEPDIRIVGEEYKGTKHTGWDLCPIHYNKRSNPYSSTEIRERIKK
ncbi:MAG TPA: glycerol-3-phosphate cytidylyltransferase [bacterium]|nr:glycerol-3-phosphate cytidylyltransferase [bacterium]